jgi:hypothetical protein
MDKQNAIRAAAAKKKKEEAAQKRAEKAAGGGNDKPDMLEQKLALSRKPTIGDAPGSSGPDVSAFFEDDLII